MMWHSSLCVSDLLGVNGKHQNPKGMMQTIRHFRMEFLGERLIYFSCFCHCNRGIDLHNLLVEHSIMALKLCVNIVGNWLCLCSYDDIVV